MNKITPIEYFHKNRERMLEELKELLRIPSVSAQPSYKDDVKRCADWLINHCKKIGLIAEKRETEGNPLVLARTPGYKEAKYRYLVYGHYDVQPPEPLELWTKTKNPFSPVIADGNIYGRGTADDKAQLFMHLKAVECFLATGTPLPCGISFLFEGEEEIGSPSLGTFLKRHSDDLPCDLIIISDTGMPALNCPAVTCGLRGVLALEVTLTGPNRDLHSGIHGGAVQNPAHVLCSMIAALHDQDGKVTIPGFYDHVSEVTEFERKQFQNLPYNDEEYKKDLGVEQLFGEKGYTSTERRTARPTLEVNGLTSGYQGQGGKTIVPSIASAKITCRTVPNQNAKELQDKVCSYLEQVCPKTVSIQIEREQAGDAYLIDPAGKSVSAALRALEKAFGCKATIMREGGSIPIVVDFKNYLKADSLLIGLSLPDDNAHSPNEKFSLECFDKGIETSIYLWNELVS